jgi:hypothetical protein
VGVPVDVLHTLQPPHDVVSSLLTHSPLQLTSPLAQVQLLFVQVAPPVHTVPQPPQLLSSVFSFTHAPLHAVYVAM